MLVRRRGRVLLIQWPEGRRWAGLWDFPRFAVQGNQEAEIHRELVDNVRRLTGVTISPGEHRKTLRHGVTRFRITLDCYDAEYVSHNGGGDGESGAEVGPARRVGALSAQQHRPEAGGAGVTGISQARP